MLIEKYKAELQARPKMLARHHERIAFMYYRSGDVQGARKHFRAAIAAFPRRPATYFYFVSSLFGRPGLSLGLNMRNMFTGSPVNPK
jgi:hypothetical protein